MRFEHEVIHWNAYSEMERDLITSRIDSFLNQIIKNKLELIDFNKLKIKVSGLNLRCSESWTPYRILYELIRLGGGQISDPTEYGFRRLPAVEHLSLTEIKRDIEIECHVLSTAHYERYIAPEFERR